MNEAREFQRRRNLPGVEVRYMSGKRYSTVVLERMGRTIGEKHDTITRGKVTSTSYHLPQMED